MVEKTPPKAEEVQISKESFVCGVFEAIVIGYRKEFLKSIIE